MKEYFWGKVQSFDKRTRITGLLLILSIIAIIVSHFILSSYTVTIGISLITFLILISLFKSLTNIFWNISRISAAIDKGELPEIEPAYEKYGFVKNLKSIHYKFLEVSKYVQSLGIEKYKFDHIHPDSKLGKALFELSKKQNEYLAEEQKRNWSIQGIAKFSDLLRINNQSLEEFSVSILRNLVKYLNANQGGFFVKKTEANQSYLELIACYAYERSKYVEKRIYAGQGVLGQVLLSKEPVYLTDIPNGYTTITSGLGEATPSSLMIVPLLVDDELYGAIELALFEELESHQRDFLQTVAEHIASAVAMMNINENTQRLLKESQVMTEDLKSQEEELRQNMEELQSTQEEMARKQADLNGLFGAIENNSGLVEFDEKGHVLHVNKWIVDKIGIDGSEFKKYAEILWPAGNKDQIIDKIKSGQNIESELKVTNKANEVLWLNVSYAPIYDHNKNFTKALLLCQDITTKKQQELEIRSHLETIDRTLISLEFTIEGRIIHVNSVFLEVSGYDAASLLNEDYEHLLHAEEINKPQTLMMWQSLKEGNYFNGQFRLKARNGESIWLNGTFNPIVDESGKPTRVMLFAQLITQEKEKQLELSQTINAIKNTSMFFEFNLNGKVKTASKKLMEELGYQKLEMMRKPLGEIVNDSEKIIKTLIGGEKENIFCEKLVFHTKNGDDKSYDVTFSKIVNSEKEIIKIIGIIQDAY